MTETFERQLTFPCLCWVEEHEFRAMIVLLSGCDVLTCGLKEKAGAKMWYGIKNKMISSSVVDKRLTCLELVSKETKLKLTDWIEWENVSND